MNKLNLETALKRYNGIMANLGYEYNQIGTRFSEKNENWNLRDMVSECDYVLSCYYDDGHVAGEMRYSEDPEERKMWKSETGKLARFIKAYEPFIDDLVCFEKHCSKYDN